MDGREFGGGSRARPWVQRQGGVRRGQIGDAGAGSVSEGESGRARLKLHLLAQQEWGGDSDQHSSVQRERGRVWPPELFRSRILIHLHSRIGRPAEFPESIGTKAPFQICVRLGVLSFPGK